MRTRPRIPRREFLNKHSNSSHFPFSISFYINNISVDRVKYPLYLLCALIFFVEHLAQQSSGNSFVQQPPALILSFQLPCVYFYYWINGSCDCLTVCVCMYVNSIITCEMSKLKTKKEYLGGCNGPGGR